MRNPFARRTEDRQAVSWPDALVEHLSATPNVSAATTGAVETASGLLARAFAGADLTAAEPVATALDAGLRATVGRALIRRGEALLVLDGDRLAVASSWWVTGGDRPEDWTYRAYLTGPSAQRTLTTGSGGVLHFTWARDTSLPWRGVSPLEAARLAGKLSAETVAALADEAAGPRGSLLPVPKDGEDPTVAQLKQDLRTLAGRLALVESLAAAMPGALPSAANSGHGWNPVRIGANPPPSVIEQAKLATAEVLTACGVPIPLASPEASDTGQREAWRRFVASTCAPLGDVLAAEIATKTGRPAAFGWSELRAADLQARARAVGQLTTAGATLDSAAAVVGFDGLQPQALPEPPEAPENE